MNRYLTFVALSLVAGNALAGDAPQQAPAESPEMRQLFNLAGAPERKPNDAGGTARRPSRAS